MAIPVAERSMARVCSRILAGILGAWTSVSYQHWFCQVEVSALGRSLVQRSLPAVVCHCLWSRHLKNEEVLARLGLLRQRKKCSKYCLLWLITFRSHILRQYILPFCYLEDLLLLSDLQERHFSEYVRGATLHLQSVTLMPHFHAHDVWYTNNQHLVCVYFCLFNSLGVVSNWIILSSKQTFFPLVTSHVYSLFTHMLLVG
jgi:hypothetical protein